MQTQLSGEQLQLSAIFPSQPAPTAAAIATIADFNEDILTEIEEKQEQIVDLKGLEK